MTRNAMRIAWTGAVAAGLSFGAAAVAVGDEAAPAIVYADQGKDWTPARRTEFYFQDQGSRLIRAQWLDVLVRDDGRPFLEDGLARYGYTAATPGARLPIGFTTVGTGPDRYVGMTCAACHTREISAGGRTYRIDGAPALVDFQSFLADLDRAVGRVLASDAAFNEFAAKVLGPGAGIGQVALLRQDVTLWYARQHTLFSRALPTAPWGVGRLDAVSMIFNRVSGLDIGTSPTGIIAENIQPADAPVRYPFIWDAPRQDRTQWPGFAHNGDALLGLTRNLGEVYGVFADFRPVKTGGLLGYDYLSGNSANFRGIAHAETLVEKIGPPRWPWAIDAAGRDRGATLFQQNCASCHGISPGAVRLVPPSKTWKTPIVDVGTDTRQYDILARTGDTGVLKGAVYGLGKNLKPQDRQISILSAAVIGTIADYLAHRGVMPEMLGNPFGALPLQRPSRTAAAARQELQGAYRTEVAETAASGTSHAYEARVLRGIWSTAPYLHNGSVASLADLLKPPQERAAAFAVGPAYDIQAVGLAAAQPGKPVRITTGCEDLHSGNSHCGHVYGTTLSAAQKQDLLEYLKAL